MYSVIKMFLCTWWLQYRKLQVMFRMSPASLQTLLTRQTVFSKTVFSIARSAFWMYSVMAIFFACFLYCNHQVHKDFLITLCVCVRVRARIHTHTTVPPYLLIQYAQFQLSVVYCGLKKLENYRNKWFIGLKTHAKREQAVRWWNPAAQICPVRDSSSFVPIPMLPCRTCLHSASSFLTVRISCHFLCSESPYLSIKLYRIYVCYMHITLYIAFGIIHGFT
jgi:hypothetical protein